MKIWKHFCTITKHKLLVLKGCFQIGLYRQGLLHDLSKYGPTEFLVGCKYYQGNMSPNNAERNDKGYSSAWLHHKGRNKHHLEYWIDYGADELSPGHHGMCGMRMPVRYVAEMFIDRVSASKNYQGRNYTDRSAYEYYLKGKDHYMMHEDTEALLEYLLLMLSLRGEKAAFSYTKNRVLKGKVPYNASILKKLQKKLIKKYQAGE